MGHRGDIGEFCKKVNVVQGRVVKSMVWVLNRVISKNLNLGAIVKCLGGRGEGCKQVRIANLNLKTTAKRIK